MERRAAIEEEELGFRWMMVDLEPNWVRNGNVPSILASMAAR